jgi:hypothetical protein
MMTRRSALLIGLGSAAFARAATTHEFWNEKKPADWSKDEIQELLTRSPWAKEASVSYNAGPGGAGRTVPGYAGGGRRSRSTTVGGPANSPGPILDAQQYKAIVRWDSALPVREALRNNSPDDPLAHYILNVTGNLPMLGTHKDEEATEADQRMEMLKQFTRLERKNDPIYLDRVAFPDASSTMFYFSRQETIFPEDKQVAFTTKLGPIEVKAKFTLKEMFYQGKLAL